MDLAQLFGPTSIITRGGWIMLPLLACSVIAVAIVLQRLILERSLKQSDEHTLYLQLSELLLGGKPELALGLARAGRTAFARLAVTILENRESPSETVTQLVETQGRIEANQLCGHLGTLSTISAVSPLLGLLGTVFGMISSFESIETHGIGNPALLAGGISEALLTTAFGLSIAIPTLVFHRYFSRSVQDKVEQLQSWSSKLLTLTQRNQYEFSTQSKRNEFARS